jgi:hypothetical protein
MVKRDLEAFINAYWEERLKAAEAVLTAKDPSRKAEKWQSPHDFLHTYMKSRFGLQVCSLSPRTQVASRGRRVRSPPRQATVVEFGYNLVDALSRYAEDPDVDLFQRVVIQTELCEATLLDQRNVVDKLIDACEKFDKTEHGGKRRGQIGRAAFDSMLLEVFPFKQNDDLVALKRALTYDQPLPEIDYSSLFEENRDGDQGKFAETLRDQHLYELMQTYPAIEAAIHEVVLQDLSSEEGRQKYAGVEKDESNAPMESAILIFRQALLLFDPKVPPYTSPQLP